MSAEATTGAGPIAASRVAAHGKAPESRDWIIEYGLERRTQAQALLAEVELLLIRDRGQEAEKVARRSLGLFASSMNWLEDTPEFEAAHELMDLAGRYVRLTFGCQLRWQGTYYEQRCPVWLAHKRIGFSPELLVREYECSVCNQNPLGCPHISGREYDGEVCRYQPKGFEPIGGVALVSRPAQPDARIAVEPMTVAKLRPFMPDGWRPGSPLSCSRCLNECTGVEEVNLQTMAREHTLDTEVDEDEPPWTITIMLADTPMRD